MRLLAFSKYYFMTSDNNFGNEMAGMLGRAVHGQQLPHEKGEPGPKIQFPKDIALVRRLQLKLAEYKKRLGEEMKKNPYGAPETFTDTNYKIAVLEQLLLTGEVDTYALSRELNGKDGEFDAQTFNNACGIVEDYAQTGGKGTTGGTGLPSDKK